MKACGRTVGSTGRGCTFGRTGEGMKETGYMAKDMDKELLHFQTEKNMMETGSVIRSMAPAGGD